MVTRKKPDADVTDAELLRRTFPPAIRKALKETVDQLDAEQTEPRIQRKDATEEPPR